MSDAQNATYGTTQDGMLAARIGDAVHVMKPFYKGGFIVRSQTSAKPIEEITSDSCYMSGKIVADEPAFRAEIADMVEHRRQLALLGRAELGRSIRTPWGQSDSAVQYADGVIFFGTPGHGGFRVYAKQNAMIPEPLRNKDGWYEEDQEWAKVAFALPLAFTTREVRLATTTLQNYFPDAYEAVTGAVLHPTQSVVKAERLFKEKHALDYVVISAIRSDAHKGMVETTATIGGERSRWDPAAGDIKVASRAFLVPSAEYDTRSRFGFVIDLDRHEPLEEPRATALRR